MKSYTWSIITHTDSWPGNEIIESPVYYTKENAMLFAESYLYDKVIFLDGMNRIGDTTIFSTDKIIKSIVDNADISNFMAHFIVQRFGPCGWSYSLVKVKVYTSPVTITKKVEDVKEVEEEEEYEEKSMIRVVVPGRIYNSYKMEEMVAIRKRPVKKQVPVTLDIVTTTMERTAVVKEVLKVDFARKECVLNIAVDEVSPFLANMFSVEFDHTNTCHTIIESGECIPSKLIGSYPQEFSYYKRSAHVKKVREGAYHPLAVRETLVSGRREPLPKYTSLGSIAMEIATAALHKFSKNKQE